MLVVLLKKTDYYTKIGETDTKVSNLDGRIDKNIVNINNAIESLSVGNILYDGGDGKQAYLIFQPVHKCFKFITGTTYISSWKSKGLSDESIKSPATSDNSLAPLIGYL